MIQSIIHFIKKTLGIQQPKGVEAIDNGGVYTIIMPDAKDIVCATQYYQAPNETEETWKSQRGKGGS